MMNYLVLSLNILYITIAMLQYFVAPKIGPNPYLGFRTGYTMSSDEAWKKSNRMMGKMMLIHSFLLLPMCLIPDSLLYFIILWVIPMILFIPMGIKYASQVLEVEGAKKSTSAKVMEPITVGNIWLIIPALLYLLLMAIMICTYPLLPNKLAVHFDSGGSPNGWATKSEFFLQYLTFGFIFPAIAFLFAYLGKKYPMFMHPGKTRFPRDTYLKTTILSMDAALLIVIFVYYTIYLYNAKNVEFPVFELLAITSVLAVIPIAFLISKWRR